jgi:hypothetical protein
MINVPDRYHCNTGDDGPAYEAIDRFFKDVRREIAAPKNRPNGYEIRVHNHEQSDDKTHNLLYRDEVVATVTETRDTGNYINFAFFVNLECLVE